MRVQGGWVDLRGVELQLQATLHATLHATLQATLRAIGIGIDVHAATIRFKV